MNTLLLRTAPTGRFVARLRNAWAQWLALDADLPQFGTDRD
jgi:hypothetical protein